MGRIRNRVGIAVIFGIAALVVAGGMLGTATTAGARTTGAKQGAKAAAPSTPVVVPLSKPLVILYGDSLAWEAEGTFVGAFAGQHGVQILTRTYGGTAI